MSHTIYSIPVKTIEGQSVKLEQYKGSVLLVVNVASQCGLTKQYEGLENLYKTYKQQGFEVLGFPSNEFAGQEPGSDEEIQAFCVVRSALISQCLAKLKLMARNVILYISN